MGQTFCRINVCLGGDFGAKGDKIKQWVEANGGTFSREIHSDVTHLICTPNAFRKRVQAVREATRMKGIKIVSVEWLEDSLLSKGRRPSREGPFLFTRGRRSAKKKASDGAKKIVHQTTAGDAPILAKPRSEIDGYHVCKDQSGTSYSALLIRPVADSKSREKHHIKIFESDSTPYTYATFVKYSRIGRSASDFLAPPGSAWEAAFSAFQKFFTAKSGRTWNKRVSKPVPRKDKGGTELLPHEGWFEYMPEDPVKGDA